MKTNKPQSTKKRRSRNKEKSLDRISAPPTNPNQKSRGRPRKLPWTTVTGRASSYEFQLQEVWDTLGTPLLSAKTRDEVTGVFRQFAEPYAGNFVPGLSSDVLSLLNDPDFPQRPIPQIKFLARSLGGRPSLSFRTSREICEKEAAKKKLKSPHRILRREFYIECSCGYKGPALDDACRDCGAEPPLSIQVWTGQAPWNPANEEKKRTPKIKRQETNQEVAAPEACNPNSVQCECGATISAASREKALEALAEHKRLEHGIE